MTERLQRLLDITETGHHFNGLRLGVDSMEELEVFREALEERRSTARPSAPAAHFQRANGYILPMASTPVTILRCGCWDSPTSTSTGSHAALQRSANSLHPNEVLLIGLKWVDVGGIAKQMADWLGGTHHVEGCR